MVQVIKRTKIDGVIHEHTMSFSDGEWKLIQKHYPANGVSFEPIVGSFKKSIPKGKPGRDDDDDKPNMKDYNVVKNMAMKYFKEEDWDKALYYFEAARKLKNFGWLGGKIAACKKYGSAKSIAKGKH